MQYMAAELIAHAKEIRDDGTIVEIVVWRLDAPLAPCRHLYKYRLFFGSARGDRVRYDNERGKGDHRHIEGREEAYKFSSIEQLLDDFQSDVENWK